jgi:hypothetical protein
MAQQLTEIKEEVSKTLSNVPSINLKMGKNYQKVRTAVNQTPGM